MFSTLSTHLSVAISISAYLLVSFVLIYALWIFYLAVMNLSRVQRQGKLVKLAYVFGMPVLIIGLILDFLTNVIVMTPLLLEFPKETTVTARLKRHNATSTGWRKKVAVWFEPLLDPFDPTGNHI